MNALLFIVAAGILQAVFLAFVIYYNPDSDKSVNRFLSLYLVTLCIPMLAPIIQFFFAWQLLFILDPFLLLSAPFLYLYVCSFKEKITAPKAWPHFILFFIFAGYNYYMYVSFGSKYPPSHHIPAELIALPSAKIRVLVRMGQMLTYVYLASKVLTSYQRSILHLFSETSKINLRWVRWLINGYFILTIVMGILYLFILRNPDQFWLIIMINTVIVTPYIYAVAYKGSRQPMLWQIRQGMDKGEVLQQMHDAEESEQIISKQVDKTPKNVLSAEKRNEIVDNVLALMSVDKIYLQTELTLQDLGGKLNVPYYQVSQAINEGMQKSFYDLVNGYRVEEAKRLLSDPASSNSKILAIGLDSGFNSKTTFNTVFKKFTGVTPSDYRQTQKQAAEV
ncbi:MAG TPA: AraC family transcriptional regulator [Chryseosolibacter sp.]